MINDDINISINTIQLIFQSMSIKCNSYCLFNSSKFANENLIGLNNNYIDNNNINTININQSIDLNIPYNEINHILYAQSLIITNEYQRCSNYLLSYNQINNNINNNSSNRRVNSSVGLFLAYYSMYLAGEKIKDQQAQEYISSNSPISSSNKSETLNTNQSIDLPNYPIPKNPFLMEIYRGLSKIYIKESDKMNGFLLYLFAVISRDIDIQHGYKYKENIFTNENNNYNNITSLPSTLDLFILSLAIEPCNWSAWLELTDYCINQNISIPKKNELISIAVNNNYNKNLDSINIMYDFFIIHYHIEKQNGLTIISTIDSLLVYFPQSTYLHNQLALAQYTNRNYDISQEIFEYIREIDPYKIDNIDIYSNILYVKERKAELSYLTHILSKSFKFHPQISCMIGNYYSLKNQHDKAITYFIRALKLNYKYVSIWTLLGHEYIELHNVSMAILCYNYGIWVNKQDYRAYYGLGQTYEMLHMYQYSLYYYKKTITIKSNDSRLYIAIGNCYQHLINKNIEAIQAYELAIKYQDNDGIAIKELVRLYKHLNYYDKAFLSLYNHYTSIGYIDKSTNSPTKLLLDRNIDSNLAESILFLANYLLQYHYNDLAEKYYNILLDYIGSEGDEARAQLRELRSIPIDIQSNLDNQMTVNDWLQDITSSSKSLLDNSNSDFDNNQTAMTLDISSDFSLSMDR